MCGIAGIISFNNKLDHLKSMVKAMHLRGPDDSGVWQNSDKTIALGHVRLSIIDLSPTGHQPMHSNSGKYSIVFNGEIYNYIELRNQLQEAGLIFKTKSDTEVILNAWEVWGDKTPEKLRGMFAFGIYEHNSNILTLVRDRLGIKPLLWSHVGDNFIFASSISSILSSGLVNRKLDNNAFIDLLSTGSVYQPRTIIEGVNSLMPGMIMQIKPGNKITTYNYWKPKVNWELRNELEKLTYNQQINLTRNLLEEACKYHLVSDVPVGSFLSGGVDSTIITALMAKNSRYPIKSFSLGFDNTKELKNELSEAKIAALHIGCDHTEIVLSSNDVFNNFDSFIESLDQPSHDGLNTYLVSKYTSNNVKVALSGLGADEIFAGYNHFGWGLSKYITKKRFGDNIISYLDNYFPGNPWSKEANIRLASPLERISKLRNVYSEKEISLLINPKIKQGLILESHVLNLIKKMNLSTNVGLDDITLFECQGYLLNTLLRDADALSMGNSIEVRPVFLDHKIVEFALSIPPESKWKNGEPKSILKESGKDLLPLGFFDRPKTGFTLPTNRWLNEDLADRFENSINDNNSKHFFSSHYLNMLKKERKNQWKNNGSWMLFVFLEWAKKNKIEVNG